MLAAVLAAVAVSVGPELSGNLSRLSSVRSSFGGVMLAACSDPARSEVGGVLGVSDISFEVTMGGSASNAV